MKKAILSISLLSFLAVISCERPSSPDFIIEPSFDIPLIKGANYKFLGGNGAIIDTTRSDFEDIFNIDGDGLVYLSSEITFNIADFDDVIPDFNTETSNIDSEFGLIEIDDFSGDYSSEIGDIESEGEDFDPEETEIGSFNIELEGDGTADFETITGIDPNTMNAGDSIAASTHPDVPEVVFVDLDVNEFKEAVIKEGGLEVTIENNLGFTLSELTAELISDGDGSAIPVGTTLTFGEIENNSQASELLIFEEGDALEVIITLRLSLQWNEQKLSAPPGNLKASVKDDDLKVKSATANIPAQVLDPVTEDLKITNENFEYAIVTDDVETDAENQLLISIENQTGIPLTNATHNGLPEITIFNSDAEIIDAPVSIQNISDPASNVLQPGEMGEAVLDLSGATLTRSFSYILDVGTPGGAEVTLTEDDFFLITIETTSLAFREARAVIDPQDDITMEDDKKIRGDFVNAEVEEGVLRVEFENTSKIPITVEQLLFYNTESFKAKNTGRFFAQGSEIAEVTNVVIAPQSSVLTEVPLERTGVSNQISYTGTASSPGTDTPVSIYNTDLILVDIEGTVELRSASAVLRPQTFTSKEEITVSDEDLRFASLDHYAEIRSGIMRIFDIDNEIDLGLDTLILSFPHILLDKDGTGEYNPADSLYFKFSGEERILRASHQQNQSQPHFTKNLENVRVLAPDNLLVYNIFAATEDTRLSQDADTVRTVESSDRFKAKFEIEDLNVKSVFGEIQKRTVVLNEDDNGNVDLFVDGQAEVTQIDDLEEISDRLSGIELINPAFDLIYDTNIGVKGTIIAAIVGRNKQGEDVYLKGMEGTGYEVTAQDDYHNLLAGGSPINPQKLIKFDIEPAETIGLTSRNKVIQFNNETTNVGAFLSNLPVEVRFIGKIIVNPESVEGFVTDPIVFDTNMGINIPLNLSTAKDSPATLEDTLSADLSELPGPEDDLGIKEITLFISYENGLPFEAGFTLEFLDENELPIRTLTGEPIESVKFGMKPAAIDSDNRFVESATPGTIEISLKGDTFDNLNKTRKIKLKGELATSRDDLSGEVKVRASDNIKLGVHAHIKTSLRVN